MKDIRVFLKNFSAKSRLRKKFLAYFLLSGIVPLALMGLVGVYGVNRTHRLDVSAIELNLAQQKAIEVEKFINDIIGLFQIQVGFIQFSQINPANQNFLLEKLFETSPALIEASFLCVTPNECVLGRETAKKSRSQQLTTEDFINQSKNTKFLTAKSGHDFISPVYFTLQGPMVTLASPVKNASGQIIAVLTGEVNLQGLQQNVKGLTLGTTGYLYIVDQRGNIVAHSQKAAVGEPLRNIEIVRDTVVGKKHTGLARNDIYTSLWGARVIGASANISKLSWGVIVEWPFEDAQKVVGQMLFQITGFSVGTLLLVILIAALVAWQLIQPITTLKEGAHIIGEGKLDHRISLRTGDEIEELGHSLNKMAKSLAELEELREIKLRAQYLAEALAKEQEVSKLKDRFIAVASHQLYTPLSVIGWTLESIRTTEVTKQALGEGLSAIDQSRKDLLAIATDLLTISDIGFRYDKRKNEPVALEVLTKEVVERLKKEIAVKKLKVNVKTATPNTTVNGERFTLDKAIEHLVANAITYSNDEEEIKIELGGDDKSATFTISDQGIGIPSDESSMVFQAFFRAKNAVEKKNVGTGLGLFIVKSIIDGHGGNVSFSTELGKGTTFTFSLPRGEPKKG